MTAPERIWVQWPHVNGAGLAFTCQARPPALRHEYIRADLATPAAMTPEVQALVDAAKSLDGAARELLAAAEAMGMFDNILADFMPDHHVRGNRKADWLKRADAARNNLKAQSSITHAALAALRAGGDA